VKDVIAYTVRVSVYAVIYALKLRALLLSTNKCVWKWLCTGNMAL